MVTLRMKSTRTSFHGWPLNESMPCTICMAEGMSIDSAKSKAPSFSLRRLSRAAPLSTTVTLSPTLALLITLAVATHQAYTAEVDEVLPMLRLIIFCCASAGGLQAGDRTSAAASAAPRIRNIVERMGPPFGCMVRGGSVGEVWYYLVITSSARSAVKRKNRGSTQERSRTTLNL